MPDLSAANSFNSYRQQRPCCCSPHSYFLRTYNMTLVQVGAIYASGIGVAGFIGAMSSGFPGRQVRRRAWALLCPGARRCRGDRGHSSSPSPSRARPGGFRWRSCSRPTCCWKMKNASLAAVQSISAAAYAGHLGGGAVPGHHRMRHRPGWADRRAPSAISRPAALLPAGWGHLAQACPGGKGPLVGAAQGGHGRRATPRRRRACAPDC